MWNVYQKKNNQIKIKKSLQKNLNFKSDRYQLTNINQSKKLHTKKIRKKLLNVNAIVKITVYQNVIFKKRLVGHFLGLYTKKLAMILKQYCTGYQFSANQNCGYGCDNYSEIDFLAQNSYKKTETDIENEQENSILCKYKLENYQK